MAEVHLLRGVELIFNIALIVYPNFTVHPLRVLEMQIFYILSDFIGRSPDFVAGCDHSVVILVLLLSACLAVEQN